MDSEAILWKVIVEDLLSLVSTDQTANNGFLQDSSVGKGLSKDDKAQKLALQHWLEAEIAAASRHRCGHNLGEEEDVLFHGVGTLQGVCEIRIRILGSRNRDIRNSKQAEDHNIGEAKKMSIHWNSLIFMVTSYQRIGRAFEATTISLYKLHTALSQNHFAAPTGSKLLTCNCLNKEQMNTKGNRVSQLDNNHESHVAVVLDIILMEDGRVQLQDNSTGCDLNNHKIIKLVLGTGETALNTAERTGNSDVEDILVEHGTVQSAKAMKAQPATAIAREFKQTVSDIKHEVHHLMEALNCWAQLDDNLTLCDLINNNHKETVPRDPAVFQHHDNTFNDQHMRKKTARRVSSFVFSTVVFLGILFDVTQVQQPLRKERDPVSMWPTLLGLFGLMVFVWAVAIMILVGSPIFTRLHTAMLLFWAILMLLQSANTTGSLGILFMGWYAYALGEATTK